MSTLLLRLAGPMQAWGTQSRFTVRDTGHEPSKSGVIGLLCAALGRPRHEPLDDLTALRMGVRVDHEGALRVDYHTAGGSHKRGEEYGVAISDAKGKPRPAVSLRYYLADADFLVGLEGDETLLLTLDAALHAPVWPLFLGRKSFVPGTPVYLPDEPPMGPGLRPQGLEDALYLYRWTATRPHIAERRALRLVMDAPVGVSGDVRQDVPLSFEPNDRRFRTRHVVTTWIEPVEDDE